MVPASTSVVCSTVSRVLKSSVWEGVILIWSLGNEASHWSSIAGILSDGKVSLYLYIFIITTALGQCVYW